MMMMFTNEPIKQKSDTHKYSETGSSINDREDFDFDMNKNTGQKNVSFAKGSKKEKGATKNVQLSQKKIEETA